MDDQTYVKTALHTLEHAAANRTMAELTPQESYDLLSAYNAVSNQVNHARHMALLWKRLARKKNAWLGMNAELNSTLIMQQVTPGYLPKTSRELTAERDALRAELAQVKMERDAMDDVLSIVEMMSEAQDTTTDLYVTLQVLSIERAITDGKPTGIAFLDAKTTTRFVTSDPLTFISKLHPNFPRSSDNDPTNERIILELKEAFNIDGDQAEQWLNRWILSGIDEPATHAQIVADVAHRDDD